MRTKQDIIDAIQQTAKENDGKPLGISRFTKETGITSYEWKQYWPRFGDAQKEAGFIPNQLTGAYPDEFLIKKLINVMHKLKKFPTNDELRIERYNDINLPSWQVCFYKYGSKKELARKIFEYCTTKNGYDDIIGMCKPILEKSNAVDDIDNSNVNQKLGEVYLFKSGRYYKIGKTNDSVRRGSEIRIQLPERTNLIHSIKTVDPSGVEAYWHKRFEAKRMQGEWFDLSSADVKEFKRWKRIA